MELFSFVTQARLHALSIAARLLLEIGEGIDGVRRVTHGHGAPAGKCAASGLQRPGNIRQDPCPDSTFRYSARFSVAWSRAFSDRADTGSRCTPSDDEPRSVPEPAPG